jgi:hypothetical protein
MCVLGILGTWYLPIRGIFIIISCVFIDMKIGKIDYYSSSIFPNEVISCVFMTK